MSRILSTRLLNMAALVVELWASTSEYWETIDGLPPHPTTQSIQTQYPNMTTLHITVGDRAQLREDTLNFIQHANKDELVERDEYAVLQFGTYKGFVDSLTPQRLELSKAIANEQPESMREVARLVDRNVSDVHSDLKHLEVLGILELREGGPSGAIQPVVPFEKIEMHIDYPLLEDENTQSTPLRT